MTFVDFFAGIGGARRGMELAGHRCVGFCEFDKFAVASYTSMHLITEEQREYLSTLDLKKRQKEILKEGYRNGEWYADDIRSVGGGDVPAADCWCFGAPCVSFSVAGRRAGLDGESGLVREVFRLLREIKEEHRPEWLVYENVRGMLSSTRGLDYLAILCEMDDCGYDAEWETFNSKEYGVPQNRERVYTVGHLRGRGSAEVFPVEGADGENNIPGAGDPEVIGGIGERNFGRQYRDGNRVYDGSGIAVALKASGVGNAGGSTNLYAIPVPADDVSVDGGFNSRGVVHSISGICRTLVGCSKGSGSGNEPKVAIPVAKSDRGVDVMGYKVTSGGKRHQNDAVLSGMGIAKTLLAAEANKPMMVGIPFGIDKCSGG